MADRARNALGLSIGATNLAAVTADVAITRKPVLTLYRQRPPEVGVPAENPKLGQPGAVVTDFVDRVGSPAGIVAADGTAHRSEALVADGLRALAYAATGGRPLPESAAVTYPAHWSPASVDAMGAALSRVIEWSNRARPLLLIPDAAAALLAVRANPGIPARGTVAVCDFGGSGTSITLMDAAGEPVAPTLRYHDFSGDMIDQAVLTAVMANLSNTAPFDPSRTIGSLSRLRNGCRSAKEHLSSSTVATVGNIRLIRHELDDVIRGPLNNLVATLDDTLRRNGIRDLAAVVSVGGGANIPAVTTTLSAHLRVPVVTTQRPHLVAAVGGGLRAAHESGDNTATTVIPVAPATAEARLARGEPATATLAWPQARTSVRPVEQTEQTEKPEQPEQPERPAEEPQKSVIPWRRLPGVVIMGAAVAMLLVGAAVAIGLGSSDKPATTPTPGVRTTQPAPVIPPPPPPPSADNSPPATTDAPAPPVTQEGTPAPAPSAAPAAKPALPRVPPIPRIPEIPPIPPIPGINEPIPGFPEIPTLFGLIAPDGQ